LVPPGLSTFGAGAQLLGATRVLSPAHTTCSSASLGSIHGPTRLAAAIAARVCLCCTLSVSVRLLAIVGLLSLAGCCLNLVSDVTGGSVNGSSSSAGSSGTSGGTGTGTGSTSGLPLLLPTFLLDAGLGLIFGPISITAPNTGNYDAAARLAFSVGGDGEFAVEIQTLTGDGLASGAPVAVATTALLTTLPNLSVSDDGTQTAVCWEDFGTTTDPYYCGENYDGPLVLCASIPEAGGAVESSYSGCGTEPAIVLNSPANQSVLFFDNGADLVGWAYGQSWGQSVGEDLDPPGEYVAIPLDAARSGLIGFGFDNGGLDSGLLLAPTGYPGCCDREPAGVILDRSFPPVGQVAAASDLGSGSIGVVELTASGLRAITWQLDAGSEMTIPLSSMVEPGGQLAVAGCLEGFVYLAVTSSGVLLFTETSFDGHVIPDGGGEIALGGLHDAVTSMAVAPAGDGSAFLAVSSLAQVAVYRVQCR
jgi:hypothetical protein